MFKTPRERLILKQGLLTIVILGGFYFFILRPFLRESSSMLDEELERKISDIKRYISRTGSLPSRESFDKLLKNKELMEGKVKSLEDFIDPEKARITDGSSEAGLYFIERLHSSMKKFSEGSSSKGITLPENLGFTEGLPRKELVDSLLRQLETVELVMDILLKSGHIEFSAIKPLKGIDYIEPITKEALYTELPVQFSIKTDTDSIIKCLLELKNSSPVVAVKEMHVRTGSVEGMIEVSLVLSSFKVARIMREKEE